MLGEGRNHPDFLQDFGGVGGGGQRNSVQMVGGTSGLHAKCGCTLLKSRNGESAFSQLPPHTKQKLFHAFLAVSFASMRQSDALSHRRREKERKKRQTFKKDTFSTFTEKRQWHGASRGQVC